MKQMELKRLKVNMCILAFVVLLFGLGNSQKTGAWFVDSGSWVEADYGIGVIDYTVYIDNVDIKKMKDGQEILLAVPLTGAAKIDDKNIVVAAVSTSGGAIVSAHDEFDEGVTLVRTKIVNKGGLPISIRAKVQTEDMSGQGMLHMVLPFGAVADAENYSVKLAETSSPQNYKSYIKSQLNKTESDRWTSYEALKADLDSYHNSKRSDDTTKDTVVYQGKLPAVPPEDVTPGAIGFEIDTLCWAEYDEMPYSQGDAARDNSPGYAVAQKNGTLIYTIICTL